MNNMWMVKNRLDSQIIYDTMAPIEWANQATVQLNSMGFKTQMYAVRTKRTVVWKQEGTHMGSYLTKVVVEPKNLVVVCSANIGWCIAPHIEEEFLVGDSDYVWYNKIMLTNGG